MGGSQGLWGREAQEEEEGGDQKQTSGLMRPASFEKRSRKSIVTSVEAQMHQSLRCVGGVEKLVTKYRSVVGPGIHSM